MSVPMTVPFARLSNPYRITLKRAHTVAAKPVAADQVLPKAAPPRAATPPVATIFHEPWWLSAASDGAYEEAVFTADNRIIGRLPYLRQRKIGWQTALVMPTMTHSLGPSLPLDLPGGERSRSLRRFSICSVLIAQLPQAGHIWFALHRRETETLAFEAAGFSTGVRFTMEIPPNTPDNLWRAMRDKTRNVIRRSQVEPHHADDQRPLALLRFLRREPAEAGPPEPLRPADAHERDGRMSGARTRSHPLRRRCNGGAAIRHLHSLGR